MKDILIIGGGIAGLITAIRLAREKYPVRLVEKTGYPRHKVCGEYVSREVEDFLVKEKLIPQNKNLPVINELQFSSAPGKTFNIPLQMGGIGVSRYYWEHFLFTQAQSENVEIIFDSVTDINRKNDYEIITRSGSVLKTSFLIGAYGKRSKIDKKLERSFINKSSPYVGVKFHALNPSYPDNLISLHNFNAGYCGMSKVEDDIMNYCYLCHRDLLREAGSIEKLEISILNKNPVLKEAFQHAERLFEKPLVINEISFETKSPVEDGMPMIGDAAGMITPLCGNGMAMAVHSAKLLSDIIISNRKEPNQFINSLYEKEWSRHFKTRLAWGRFIQRTFFGKNWASSLAVSLGNNIPSVTQALVRQTHGKKIS
ncbi:MAG: NAD(P)/FAD-dependent oxidoreductase [Candidatus Cyclobacteriaceae bacterium M2_1C_046]